MQLPKRKENSFSNDNPEKDWGRGEPIDFKIYEIDYEAQISYGKYIGKSLGYVRMHDQNYYGWMINHNILSSWGLVKLKNKVPAEYDVKNGFVSSTGQVWLFIYEVQKKGRPSPFL